MSWWYRRGLRLPGSPTSRSALFEQVSDRWVAPPVIGVDKGLSI